MQKILFSVMTVLLLSGCSVTPDYHRPQTDLPANWREQTAAQNAIDKAWWQQFNSADLDQFIAQAQTNNNDLGASLQRVEQARAQIDINRSTLFPSVIANANLANNDGNRTRSVRSLGGGVSLAYEVDLWGRNRAATDAARHDLQASQYDYDALRLITDSDTAQSYFNILGLQARIKKADENLKLSQDVLQRIQARFTQGAASGQDVAQQKTALATQQASIASLRQQFTNAQSQLNVLMGRAPQNVLSFANPASFDALVIPAIAPLQPASLLERRPDLAVLEEQLKAADLDIAIARTSFYPSLTIGLDTSASLSPLSGPVQTAAGLVGGITAPLYTGGRLQGQLNLTTARQRELAQNYKGAVLVAFQEAENALSAVKAATEREVALKTARDEANRYYGIARDRYLNGADDFLTLLDAQRTLLQNEDAYIQARLDQLSAALALFKAMGGGWSVSINRQ